MKSQLLVLLLLFPALAFGQAAYSHDKVVIGRTGQAIPQASIAVCTQPATTSTTPCSTLATLYPDSDGTNYIISTISCSNDVVTVSTSTSNTIPANQRVVISGVRNAAFDGTFQVTSSTLTGTFTYAQACTNGSSSGGTVSAANPTFSDGLGNYSFYAATGAYTVQVYGNTINTMVFPGQSVGQPSLLGSTNTWTGTNIFSGTVNLNNERALEGSFSGPTTLTGNLTATAGQNSLTLHNLDGVTYCDKKKYTTLTACIAAVPSSGGTAFVPQGFPLTAGVQVELKSNLTLEFDAGTFTAPVNNGSAVAVLHFANTVSGARIICKGIDATAIQSAATGTQFLAVIQDEGTNDTIEGCTLNGNGNTTSPLVSLKATKPHYYKLKLIADLTFVAGHNYGMDIRGGNNFDVDHIETSGGSLGGFSIVARDANGDYGNITGGNFCNLLLHDSPHNGLDINVNASATSSADTISALSFSNVFAQHNGTIANHGDDEYGIVVNATLLSGDTGSLNNLNFSNVWAFNNAGSGMRLKGNVFNCEISGNIASNATDTTATSTDAIVLATGTGTTHPQFATIIASGNKGGGTNFLSTQANSATNQFILTTGDPISLSTTNDNYILRSSTAYTLSEPMAIGSGSRITSSGSGGTVASQGVEINSSNQVASAHLAGAVAPGAALRWKITDHGTCTMASGACTAQSLGSTYSAAPQCFASWNGTGTLTGIIKVPSTTTTVTPASSVGTDTAQVNWFCRGN